jgi:hypothetical protein
MYGEHLDEPQKAVVKLRRFRAGTEPFWQSRLDTNAHASGVSSVFTEKTGAGKITFIDQYLAPFKGYCSSSLRSNDASVKWIISNIPMTSVNGNKSAKSFCYNNR